MMRLFDEYRVFHTLKERWLADDEKSWTTQYDDAAVFTDANLARDIALRENDDEQRGLTIHGIMGED